MHKRFYILLLCVLLSAITFGIVRSTLESSDIAWVLATTVLMASLWITEAIPMGVTSLLPMAIFPLVGIADMKDITPLYAKHIIFLFIAGFLLAFAMEKWNLHQRMAYKVISLVGFKPVNVLLGFILASFVLSMWISNTAATIVLLAPALAIIKEFNPDNKPNHWFGITLLLGICYASSIGGTVTPIGTAPNLLLLSHYEKAFPDEAEITFFDWMKFALPVASVFIIILFFYLAHLLKKTPIKDQTSRLKERVKSLPAWSFEEKVILFLFVSVALLWMTARKVELGFIDFQGWTQYFENPKFIRDSAIGMAVALLLFMIPSKKEKGKNLLEWKDAQRLPFDILFIFGGGFALAEGFTRSGLDEILVVQMAPLSALPVWLMIIGICLFMTFLTEITSNTATTQLILPLLILVAQATDINPIYLLIPATFSASYAFMLPVATPPNAIVFGTGLVSNKSMMRTGIWLNLIGVVLLSVYVYFFGEMLG